MVRFGAFYIWFNTMQLVAGLMDLQPLPARRDVVINEQIKFRIRNSNLRFSKFAEAFAAGSADTDTARQA